MFVLVGLPELCAWEEGKKRIKSQDLATSRFFALFVLYYSFIATWWSSSSFHFPAVACRTP